jgi:predicted permease
MVARTAPVDLGVDLRVLLFTLAVSLLAALLSGLAPALRLGATAAPALRVRGDGGTRSGRVSLTSGLVVAQVALSLTVLVAAGLLVRSFVNLLRQDLGFRAEGVLLVGVDTELAGLRPAELPGFYRRLTDRVEAIPGVRSATLVGYSPLSGTSASSNGSVEGFTPAAEQTVVIEHDVVGPRHAETLGLPILLGRDIDERDRLGAPRVAVVNAAFVAAFLGGGNPLGRRFAFGDDPAKSGTFEIVGVVGDARFREARETPRPMAFLPLLQAEGETAHAGELVVRVSGDPLAVAPALRRGVAEIGGDVPVVAVSTLEAQLRDTLRRELLLMQLVGFFGALATVLACVGLYGVVAQAVARRTNEMGIRLALGAGRGELFRLVLRQAGFLIGLGIALGLPAALAATRLLAHQLFGVTAADPATFAAACALLVTVAGVGGLLPARRAARLDPLTALRSA